MDLLSFFLVCNLYNCNGLVPGETSLSILSILSAKITNLVYLGLASSVL